MPHKHKSKESGESREASRLHLSPDISGLIAGSVIDLSKASYFFKKKADACTELQGLVEPLPNSRYRLREPFWSFFVRNLPVVIKNYILPPADALADALYQLGRKGAKIDFGQRPIATEPSDELLRGAWEGVHEWEAYLRYDACIGQGWWLTLADDGSVQPWSGKPDPRDFELWIRFGDDTTKPPSMAITITGKRAATFMKLWMTFHKNSPPQKHSEGKELGERVEIVLDEIVKTLKTKLRLLRAHKGRPSSDFGELAAFRLHHQNQSIALVAKELCQLPGDAPAIARRQCFDRIRKAIDNYYKRLRSEFFAEKPEWVRQRIIRIPAGKPASSQV